MKGILSSRWLYLVILLVLAVGALLSIMFYPVLIGNAVNTFGFLGFWLTLYGLIIAIFEIVRAGSVANKIAIAAETSHNDFKRQVEDRDMKGCMEIINIAIDILNSKKAVPVFYITNIKQVYISAFSQGRKSDSYASNLTTLNSYMHVAQTRTSKVKPNPHYNTNPSEAAKLHQADHPYIMTISALKNIQDEIMVRLASRAEYQQKSL